MPPKKKAAGKAPAKAVAKAAEGTEGFPIIKYAEGDLVRSLDMVKLYPAKVLKVGSDDQYFIHYQGWNKKWDKWVHASLLMKEGPEADKYAKDLEEQEKKRKAAREAEKRG
jgi:mortality factor 4-like protein 1